MIDSVTETTIFNYLYRHYPIKRLKDDTTKRFRRGIAIANQKFFFQPKSSAQMLFSSLYNDLEMVFGLTTDELTPVLFKYLYLNKYYKLKE